MTLKQYMTTEQHKKLGGHPTLHCNYIDKTGVARPGKTARNRAKKTGFPAQPPPKG